MSGYRRRNLAPPGQIGWSGQNWYETPPYSRPTIAIIESPAESYEGYRRRKNREETDGPPRKVPFGFSRALENQDET